MKKIYSGLKYLVLSSFFVFSTALPLANGGGFWQDPEDEFIEAKLGSEQRRKMCHAFKKYVLQHPGAFEKLKEKAKKVDCADEQGLQKCAMLIERLITSIIAEDRKNPRKTF